MAPGSQSCRGHWALLAAAPANIRTNEAATAPLGSRVAAPPMTSLHRQRSVVPPRSRTPPSKDRPPSPVVAKACRARRPASGSSRSQPMRRNELIEVISQNRTVSRRWSARTMPSMAVVKNPRVGRKRANAVSSGPKKARLYRTTRTPTPAMRRAKNVPRPSTRKLTSRWRLGTQARASVGVPSVDRPWRCRWTASSTRARTGPAAATRGRASVRRPGSTMEARPARTGAPTASRTRVGEAIITGHILGAGPRSRGHHSARHVGADWEPDGHTRWE